MTGMRFIQGIPEPLAPFLRERGESLREVGLILWSWLPGFVQKLNLGSEIRNSFRRDAAYISYRANDGGCTAKEPPILACIGDHELDRPRLRRGGTAPDIVDGWIEYFVQVPGGKRPRLVAWRWQRGLHIPVAKQ